MIFILYFVNVIYFTDQFSYVETSLCPWNKCYMIVMYFFNILLYSICQYFAQDFCICVHQGYWYVVCVCVILARFGNQVMLSLQNAFRRIASSLISWKSLRMIDIRSYSMVWQNSPVNPSGPKHLFLGRFLMIISISSLLISLFRFSSCSLSSLGRLYISRNLSISFSLLHLVANVFHNILV